MKSGFKFKIVLWNNSDKYNDYNFIADENFLLHCVLRKRITFSTTYDLDWRTCQQNGYKVAWGDIGWPTD